MSLLPGAMESCEPVIQIVAMPCASSWSCSVPVPATCSPEPLVLVPCNRNCDPCAVNMPFTSIVLLHNVTPEEIVKAQLFALAEPTVTLPAYTVPPHWKNC